MINIPSLDLVLFLVLFGPSALSLAFTIMARKVVQNDRLRLVCRIIAFILLVLQGRLLLGTMIRVVTMIRLGKEDGEALAVLFTVAGSIGFLVSVAFWVKYVLRPVNKGERSK
jgi:hypothetical protein